MGKGCIQRPIKQGILKAVIYRDKKKYFFGLGPSEYYRNKHVRHLMIIVRLLTMDDLQEKSTCRGDERWGFVLFTE